MALCRILVLCLCSSLISGAAVRKPPAFATPVYSNSYLPAAMQVIFYGVEQLKVLQAQENMTTTSVSPVVEEEHSEESEVNEETPEANYATPETTHEQPEGAHGTPETSDAVLATSTNPTVTKEPEIMKEPEQTKKPEQIKEPEKNKEPEKMKEPEKNKVPVEIKKPEQIKNCEKNDATVDSVVEEIYGIVQTTTITQDPAREMYENSDKAESIEDQEEENRFNLLGEKVTQVPRPSLSNYLKRANIPASGSLQQLAGLYDSLSKDARKQGFGKFAGYSDEVLLALESSSEGGIGPQLKTLLDKIVERNELTRDEASNKTMIVLRDLDDPASQLTKDLRRILPLRFTR